MADMLAAIQSSSNSLVLNAGHSDTLGPFLTVYSCLSPTQYAITVVINISNCF